jgi:hypothetical protein
VLDQQHHYDLRQTGGVLLDGDFLQPGRVVQAFAQERRCAPRSAEWCKVD